MGVSAVAPATVTWYEFAKLSCPLLSYPQNTRRTTDQKHKEGVIFTGFVAYVAVLLNDRVDGVPAVYGFVKEHLGGFSQTKHTHAVVDGCF